MGWLNTKIRQWQIRQAIGRLGASSETERTAAVLLLQDSRHAGVSFLQRLIEQEGTSPDCIWAAVALHTLGDPTGIITLRKITRWNAVGTPPLLEPLEHAWLEIEREVALSALLDIWRELPATDDYAPLLACICRIWMRQRAPRVLDALFSRALEIPELFPQAVHAFGTCTLPYLRHMLREPDPQARLLALSALKQTFLSPRDRVRVRGMLQPLLQDPSVLVRGTLPSLLENIAGATSAAYLIMTVLQDDHATLEAVRLIARIHPLRYQECLFAILDRWNSTHWNHHDTPESVQAALQALSSAPEFQARFLPAIRHLIARGPGIPILIAAVQALRAQSVPQEEGATFRALLWPLLSHPEKSVRAEVVHTLQALEEPFSLLLLQWLPTCGLTQDRQFFQKRIEWAWPEEAATWRRHGNWISAPRLLDAEEWDHHWLPATLFDTEPRLPVLITDLLCNSLDRLEATDTPENIQSMLAQAEDALLAIQQFSPEACSVVRSSLLRALYTTLQSPLRTSHAGPPFAVERHEIGSRLRLYAAQALINLYGSDSFGLLSEAVYADHHEIKVSAIQALASLGDARALSILQPLVAADPSFGTLETNPSADHAFPTTPKIVIDHLAAQAIRTIRQVDPHLMTLVRSASPPAPAHDSLLRPAYGNHESQQETLLRPTIPPGFPHRCGNERREQRHRDTEDSQCEAEKT